MPTPEKATGSGPVSRPLWPLVTAIYAGQCQEPIRILTPDNESLHRVAGFLRIEFPNHRVVVLPGWDVGIYDHTFPDPRIVADAAMAANALASSECDILVADIAALFSPMPVYDVAPYLDLQPGSTLEEVQIINRGYRRVTEVSAPGEFLVRGDSIDIWSPLEKRPARIERFDIEIESLKRFDPVSQISARPLEHYSLGVAGFEHFDEARQQGLLTAIDNRARRVAADPRQVDRLKDALALETHFPGKAAWLAKSFPQEELTLCWDIVVSPDNLNDALDRIAVAHRAERRNLEMEGFVLPHIEEPQLDNNTPYLVDAAGKGFREFNITSIHPKPKRDPREQLQALLPQENDNMDIWITADPEDRNAITNLLKDTGWGLEQTREYTQRGPRQARWVPQRIRGHWDLPPLNLRVIDGGSFLRRRTAKRIANRRGLDLGDIRTGDYVVHEDYGIGRFEALERLVIDESSVDVVKLSYADGDTVMVPVSKIALVAPYRGSEDEEPKLDKLGSDIWQKRKSKVKEDLLKFAGQLLDLYASRERAHREPLSAPGEFTAAIEASFPYEETPGQLQALTDIEEDLDKQVPMDRLLVGDVGYGKTEIALRTAVRFVEAGYQVAMLVPTTVLAVQHGNSFHDRLRDLPVRVGVLSRFTPAGEKRDILEGMKTGKIDIVIGTHRLLQPDIQFQRLGLLIIDEEHRFGVKHKEALKSLRRDVDTLAMSATPIPRTLQLHIGGFRPLSMIATPPPNRLGVETVVQPYDDDTVREALLRERARGGQAFFLQNRIEALDETSSHLQKLIPDLKIGIAHGKMRAPEIEDVFIKFGEQRIDVLLATSLIESGLDFPKANTLIVHDAQNHGLADLYQLRGRVGRSDRRAFAYLLYPTDKNLSDKAHKRLEVLRSFSNLGAGFNVAMRDLEIRGAGELLGKRQAGSIKSIGLNTLFRLLEDAVAEAQGFEHPTHLDPDINTDFDLTLSQTWLPDIEARLRTYQRLAKADSVAEIDRIVTEACDRYGPQGSDDERYISVMKLRPSLIALHARALTIKPQAAHLFLSETTPLEPIKVATFAAQASKIQLQPDRIVLELSGDPTERVAQIEHYLRQLIGLISEQ